MASAGLLAGQIPTDAGALTKPKAGGPPASNNATTRGNTQTLRAIGNWQGKEEKKGREKRKSNAKSPNPNQRGAVAEKEVDGGEESGGMSAAARGDGHRHGGGDGGGGD